MVKNIVEAARDTGLLATFVALIESAGLTQTLADDGQFTMFAPSDEAFAALPIGTVEDLLDDPGRRLDVLTYHLIPGRVTVREAAQRRRLLTYQGEDLTFNADGIWGIGGAHLVATDLEAGNGVIHVIDRVLLPAAP